jgi:undecaprenyl-diphosphatase
MDAGILQQVIALRRPWLDDVMVLASALGGGGFLWIIIGSIAGIFPRHTAAMWRLWLAVLLSFLIVDDVVKPFFDRARPFDVLEIHLIDARPASASFPSGHAAMAMAGTLAVTRMLPHSGWILWPMAIVIAISRLYLGVHWPSDVAGGILLGFATGWLVLGPPQRGRVPPASHF